MEAQNWKAVRIFQSVVAAILALYAYSLNDTTAAIGVVVYMQALHPALPSFLLVCFAICAIMVMSQPQAVTVRWYLICITPQIVYSAFAIGWFFDTPRNLSIAALWLHPAISALIIAFAYREAHYGLHYDTRAD